jgi:hypothetical protein
MSNVVQNFVGMGINGSGVRQIAVAASTEKKEPHRSNHCYDSPQCSVDARCSGTTVILLRIYFTVLCSTPLSATLQVFAGRGR